METFASTCPTNSIAKGISVGVLFVVFMAIAAMSFSPVITRDSESPPQILFASDRFQMPRVDAFGNSAKMVYNQSFANCTSKVFVSKSVGHYDSGFFVFPLSEYPSITKWRQVSSPFPTSSGHINMDFVEESFDGGYISTFNKSSGNFVYLGQGKEIIT